MYGSGLMLANFIYFFPLKLELFELL